LNGPHFPRRGSHPIRPSGEVQMTMKTSSGRMVKCWIPKIYFTNPSTEPSIFSRHVYVRTEAWRTRGSWILIAHDT
jgi:hypothetical protein